MPVNAINLKSVFHGRITDGDEPKIELANPEAWLRWKLRMQGMIIELYLDKHRMEFKTISEYDYLTFVLIPILAEVLGYESNYAALQAILGEFCRKDGIEKGKTDFMRMVKLVEPAEKITDVPGLVRAVRAWMQTPGMISESGIQVPNMEDVVLSGDDATYDGEGLPLVRYHLGDQERYLRFDRYRIKQKSIFRGMIARGKFPPFIAENKLKFNAHIARLSGEDVMVAAWKFFPIRTNPQNAYYWAVVIPIIDWAAGIYEPVLTHELIKWQHLRVEARVSEKGFTRPAFTRSTTELTTKGFNDFLEAVFAWVQEPGIITEQGITIPKPNEHFVPRGLGYLDGGEVKVVGKEVFVGRDEVLMAW